MHEIAKLIFKMYESAKPEVKAPEDFDKLNYDFFIGLSNEQKDMFLKLETMYLEIMETQQISFLEFLLGTFVEE